MATFIQQHGEPQIPPPYRFPNVSICSFRLSAEISALTALCDEVLNACGTLNQRGFEYRAALPFVDLEILTYPRMQSEAPGFEDIGYTVQRELYFRLFVAKFISGNPVPTEIAVFMPYILVDNTWSLISGREVIGYPKVRASFKPASPSECYSITVKADAYETYGRNEQLALKPLVKVGPKPLSNRTVFPAYKWPWGVIDKLIDVGTLDPNVVKVLRTSQMLNIFSTIQLKQIRDAENMTLACYQALIHAEFQAMDIVGPNPLPPAQLTIYSYASLPIVERLGLASAVSTPLNPLLQYSLTCNLWFGNAANLFVCP